MKKRLLWMLCCLMMVCAFSGCGVDRSLYDEMAAAQRQAGQMQSGIITLTVAFEEEGVSGEYAAELLFCKTENGTYAYCQKQYDPNEQITFCEYSDGTKTEQWMIGRGWEEIGEATFTEENPHRYLTMLSTAHEHGAIQTLEKESDGSGTRYLLTLDPNRAKELYYKESGCSVVSQTVTVSFDAEGHIVGYCEETVLHNDESGCDNTYRAELTCRDHDLITEAERPQLRTQYGRAK